MCYEFIIHWMRQDEVLDERWACSETLRCTECLSWILAHCMMCCCRGTRSATRASAHDGVHAKLWNGNIFNPRKSSWSHWTNIPTHKIKGYSWILHFKSYKTLYEWYFWWWFKVLFQWLNWNQHQLLIPI